MFMKFRVNGFSWKPPEPHALFQSYYQKNKNLYSHWMSSVCRPGCDRN